VSRGGSGSVGPSEPDGWTNEMHYKLLFLELFFLMEKVDVT
jgi:hypothetical protein